MAKNNEKESMKKRKKSIAGLSEFIIYQTDNGQTKLQIKLEDETVWLT